MIGHSSRSDAVDGSAVARSACLHLVVSLLRKTIVRAKALPFILRVVHFL
jgi:hypothetical protein